MLGMSNLLKLITMNRKYVIDKIRMDNYQIITVIILYVRDVK